MPQPWSHRMPNGQSALMLPRRNALKGLTPYGDLDPTKYLQPEEQDDEIPQQNPAIGTLLGQGAGWLMNRARKEGSESPMVDPALATRPRTVEPNTATRERRVETDKRGRPTPNITMTGVEQAEDLNQRLKGYEPQKSSGWSRFLPILASLAAPTDPNNPAVSTAGHALGGLFRSLVDPKYADRRWKDRELAKSEDEVAARREQRTQDWRARLLQAQVAKAEAVNQPEKPKDIEVGGRIVRPNTSGGYDTVFEPPAKPEKPQPRLNPSRTAVVDGKEVYIDDEGRPILANGQPIVKEAPKPEPPDLTPDIKGLEERIGGYQSELEQHRNELATKQKIWNQQANAAYKAALDEYRKEMEVYKSTAGAPKPTKPARKEFYEAAQADDPHFVDGTVEKVNTRIKELEEAIKGEKGNLDKLRGESRKAAPKTQASVKPAKDGKWHYTPEQIRASLQPGQGYEEIYAKLKANPSVVIDEK